MTADRALIIMARYPELGVVKTRIAAAYGAERATALYRAFIADLDARFRDGPRQLVWAYHPADRDFASIVRGGDRCVPQRGDNLGARMHAAFSTVLGWGCDSAVMIGADVPHVRDAWIVEAESRLADVDVVLGPSADGGYYLVAMRAPHDIFSDVAMSTPTVLQQTSTRIETQGLRLHLLPPSFDVDEGTDIEHLRNELGDPELRRQLPATSACVLTEFARPD